MPKLPKSRQNQLRKIQHLHEVMRRRRKRTTIPLSDEQVLQLLEHFKKEEVLWNPLNASYNKISAKQDAINWIVQAMNIPNWGFQHAKSELCRYRNNYSKELKKTSSTNVGESVELPFWFESIGFLKDNLEHVTYLDKVLDPADDDEDFPEETSREGPPDEEDHGNELVIIKEEPEEMNLNLDEQIRIDIIMRQDAQNGEIEIVPPVNPLNVSLGSPMPTTGKIKQERKRTKKMPVRSAKKKNTTKSQHKNVKKQETHAPSNTVVSSSEHSKQLWAIAKCQEDILKILTKQENRTDGHFDNFARYVASLLKALPIDRAHALEPQIIKLVTDEHLKLNNETF